MCSFLYCANLRRVASKVAVLDAQHVNAYLRLRLTQVSPGSVANERRMLLTLWSWAWEEGMCDNPLRGVMSIRTPSKPVEAWTIGECSALVKATSQFNFSKMRNGTNLGLFLRCWVLVAYETGARYGDIFAFTNANVGGGCLSWTTSKTGIPCCRNLSLPCQSAISDMMQGRPVGPIFGGCASRRYSFALMRRLLAASGLPGSGKWLRRSGATHVEQTNPGMAQRFLGHKSANMAAQHYLDQRQLQRPGLCPPAIV